MQVQFALVCLDQIVGSLAVFEAFLSIVSLFVVPCDLGVDADFGEFLLLFFEYLGQALSCLNVISLLCVQRRHGPVDVLW